MSTPPDRPDETEAAAAPQTPGIQVSPSAASEPRRPWYASTWVIIAYSACLILLFCIIGFIPYWETFIEDIQKPFQRAGPVSPTPPVADTLSACVVIWVEHQPDDLGKKSRATVWKQKVSAEVKASGMTPREFYELVVEHNPQLIQDDYEFKKGRKYLLPECQ